MSHPKHNFVEIPFGVKFDRYASQIPRLKKTGRLTGETSDYLLKKTNSSASSASIFFYFYLFDFFFNDTFAHFYNLCLRRLLYSQSSLLVLCLKRSVLGLVNYKILCVHFRMYGQAKTDAGMRIYKPKYTLLID